MAELPHDIEYDETTADRRRAHQRSTGKGRWASVWANKKVLAIAAAASFGGFEYGYQQGVLGEALVMYRFNQNFPSITNSSTATGWLTSILQIGGVVGSLSAGTFGEVYSRKYTMFSGCIWVMLGSFLYVGASEGHTSLLYAGRFITGLGVGTFSAVGPLYNAELAPPEMRGLLVSSYQFAVIFGIMLSFWVGYGSNYIGGTGETQSNMAWRLPSIVQGIPAVILCFAIFLLPFSPRWLVKQNRDAEALKTLSYLRSLPEDHELVQLEYLEIKAERLADDRAFAITYPKLAAKNSIWLNQLAQYADCFRTKDNFRRVAIAFLVMFWQQWSGVDAILYYIGDVFQDLGLTGGTTALLATGVTGIVFLVCTVPAMVIIDSVGRKPMLIVGSGVMLFSMVVVGILVALFHKDWPSHVAAGWVCVVLIWVYIGAFGATWGPVSWTLVSEISPPSIRAKVASIGAFSNWINNFAIAFFVPTMFKAVIWLPYIFFAGFLAAGIVWVYFVIPETKGKTLEEMDMVFGSRTGERDAALLREAQNDVGLTRYLKGDRGSDAYQMNAMPTEKAANVQMLEHGSGSRLS